MPRPGSSRSSQSSEATLRASDHANVTPTTGLPPAAGFSLTNGSPRTAVAGSAGSSLHMPRVVPRSAPQPSAADARTTPSSVALDMSTPRPRPPQVPRATSAPVSHQHQIDESSNRRSFAELNAALQSSAAEFAATMARVAPTTASSQSQVAAASPARSGRKNAPEDVASAHDVMNHKFRSVTLQLDIALRELIAEGAETPPSEQRIKRVFKLYDTLIAAVPAGVGDLLRMFRVEFCRAIFSPTSGNGAIDITVQSVPFFERFESLLRENNMLNAELTAAEMETTAEQLQHQVQKLQSLGSYYEHEITRLTKENARLREEVDRMTKDIDTTAVNNQKVFVSLDEQNHRLAKEARELQLQVFRLHKEARDQVANQNLYAALRTAKMDELGALYDSGHELSGLMLTLHQIEGVMNGVLTVYEHKIIKSSAGELSSNRTKYVKEIEYLLDEYHEVNNRRNAIEMLDRGQGEAPVEPHSDAWRLRIQTANALPGLVAVETDRGFAADTSNAKASDSSKRAAKQRSPTARGDPRRWAEILFGSVIGSNAPPVFHANPWTHMLRWEAKTVSKHAVTNPMFNVGGDRFMAGVDLFVSTGVGAEYACHKTFPWVDPAIGVELPAKSTHVKIKFHSPMVKEPTRNFGAEDVLRLDSTRHGDAHHRWRPFGAPGSEEAAVIARLASAVQGAVVPASGGEKRDSLTDENAPDPVINDTYWEVFRDRFGAYTPFLPRSHRVELVDIIMLSTFTLHAKTMKENYARCTSVAQGRSSGAQMLRVVTERFFREEFDSASLQHCFFDVVETYFTFPEVVMKVAHELLTSMEQLAASDDYPHVRVYLSCLGRSIAPPLGHVLAMAHTSLCVYWPLASADRHLAISAADLRSVLRGVYPTEGAVRVNVEDLTTDIMVFCDGKPTMELVKRYFSESFLQVREPVLAKAHEAVIFKASVVHWSELDVHNFWEAIRNLCSEEVHDTVAVQHIVSCCVYDRPSRLPPEELAHIAAYVIWMETAKLRPSFR